MATMPPYQQRLEQSLDALLQAIEGLESALPKVKEALLEFAVEETLNVRVPKHLNGQGARLLTLTQVCKKLEKDESLVSQLLESGQIPAVVLGGTIKVRQADLEEYLKALHNRPLGDENGFVEE